jgi:hypothetical protein
MSDRRTMSQCGTPSMGRGHVMDLRYYSAAQRDVQHARETAPPTSEGASLFDG